jgi:hypothetical protein
MCACRLGMTRCWVGLVMARLIGGRYDGTVKTGKQRFGTHVGVFKDLIMSSFGF